MKIELTTEKDAVEYIEFLKYTEKLSEVVGKIALEGEEAEDFLMYKAALAKKPLKIKKEDIPERAGASWSKAEDAILKDLIQKNVTPSDIGLKLSRNESGVRSRASRKANKRYSGRGWWDIDE